MMAAINSFFFFQGEDGIRDATVTGVQTCALPISAGRALSGRTGRAGTASYGRRRKRPRSEERRVGKECRSRWSPHHQKKKIDKPHRAHLGITDRDFGFALLCFPRSF